MDDNPAKFMAREVIYLDASPHLTATSEKTTHRIALSLAWQDQIEQMSVSVDDAKRLMLGLLRALAVHNDRLAQQILDEHFSGFAWSSSGSSSIEQAFQPHTEIVPRPADEPVILTIRSRVRKSRRKMVLVGAYSSWGLERTVFMCGDAPPRGRRGTSFFYFERPNRLWPCDAKDRIPVDGRNGFMVLSAGMTLFIRSKKWVKRSNSEFQNDAVRVEFELQ